MRMVVTGGTGFLGVHVVELAVEAGHDVLVAGRQPPAAHGIELPPGVEHLVVEEWSAEPGRGQRDLLARASAADAVLHLAAISRAADVEADPARAFAVNAAWPAALAKAARKRIFVHASTDLVLGATLPSEAGFPEDALPDPIGAYGESKAAGERAVHAAHPGAHIARLPLLFGDSRGRGQGASDGLFAALRRHHAGEGPAPGLFTDEWRTPLDVRAAAHALVLLTSHLVQAGAASSGLGAEPDFPSLIWHLGGRRLSRYELGHALCLAAGLDPTPLRATTRAAAGLSSSRAGDASLSSDATCARLPELAPVLAQGSAPPIPKS